MKNNLSDNIKKLRKDNNLSQEDLADKLGVSRQSISKWEQGDAYPEMDKLMQMAELFNVSLDNLVHSNINDVKTKENNKKTIDNYIKTVSSFITDAISLFARMNFKSKIKFIIEEFIIIFLLGITFAIVGELCSAVVSNLYVIPGYKYLYIILETLYEAFGFVAGVMIVTHVFKVRYLDYYRSAIASKEDNKPTEEGAKDVKEKQEEKVLKPAEDKIIIRDPKTSEYGFLKAISKVFIIFFKAIAFYMMIGVSFALVGLAFAFGLSVLIINSGSFYVGVVLTIISSIVSLAVILMVLINFIFNKAGNKKVLALLFILSIIFFGIGLGVTTASLANFDVYDIKEADIKNDGVTIKMSDNIFLTNEYDITYIEEDRKDIKVTPIDGTCDVTYYIQSDGRIVLTQDCDLLERLKFTINEINNKRICTNIDDYYHNYTVYASKKNIEKLKKNEAAYYKRANS